VEALLKRSACYYKLDKFADAITDANAVLKQQPNNSKACLRKGMACFSLDEFETALSAFQKGQELEPENSTFKTWIRKCVAELESETGTVVPIEDKTQKVTTESVQSSVQSSTPVANIKSSEAPKIRHEWYQTQTHVFVTIFSKNVKKEETILDIQKKSLSITIKLSTSNEYQFDVDLSDEIVPEESTTSFLSTKVEIKMKKASPTRWKTLEDTGEPVKAWDSVSTAPPPVTSQKKKNWDKIVEEETQGEKLEGEESLNKVFQDIYSNATEEQKRAMMKSYLESGGTVLSTNWDEVGKGEVKGSPPEGLEMKNWNELSK